MILLKLDFIYCNNFFERSGYNYSFFYGGSIQGHFFVSKYEYSICKKHEYSNIYFFKNKVLLQKNNNKIIDELDPFTFKIKTIEFKNLPIFEWGNFYLIRENDLFKVISNTDTLLYEFTWGYNNAGARFIEAGILEYFDNTSRNNWLRLIDPATGQQVWRVDYPKAISYLTEYDGVIVFTYIDYRDDVMALTYDPSYIVALNAQTGEELWRISRGGYLNFTLDKDHGVVLCMQVLDKSKEYGHIIAAQALEIDLHTGLFLSSPTVTLMEHHGFEPKFVDETAFYYTNDLGSFGKIKKSDGLVEWEFDLIDDKGSKRKVQDWLKLGNGKFVLQTPPNHKNGDFSCIFDPAENMEHASVVNGVRLKEALKPSKR